MRWQMPWAERECKACQMWCAPSRTKYSPIGRLFDAGFLTSMDAAEREVRRKAIFYNDTVAALTHDRADVEVGWSAALDERSQERIGITLRDRGLLNEDYDAWYLSEGGKELREQYKLYATGPDISYSDRPS